MESSIRLIAADAGVPKDQQPESKWSEFTNNLTDSFRYSFAQAPLTGSTQLIDRVIGSKLEEKVTFMEPPKPAEVGTAAWYGQVGGTTLGGSLHFAVLYKVAGPGAATRLETSATYGLGRQALPAIGKSAIAGSLYSGVFMPTDPTKDFWSQRLNNTVVGGVTFSALTATSIGLKSTGIGILRNDIVAGGLAGAPAGVLNADLHSLIEKGTFAKGKDRLNSVLSFTAGGVMLGAGNMAHEFVRPSTGIRGVRTLEDMIKLADSTVVSPKPQAGEPARPLVIRLDHSTKAAVAEALQVAGLSPDTARMLTTAQGEWANSLGAVQEVGLPIATIYGSARLGPNTFQYHRARYMAALLAREGYAVSTGGGPGIMEAGNRGAYEAGGTSVGINIRLPHEQSGNQYQRVSMTHSDFTTRKHVLRHPAEVFVIEEGGWGTADEAMELLTHIQTGKSRGAPVFFMGSEHYKPLDTFFRHLARRGVISPNDLNYYKIVDNPQQVIQHMRVWRAQQAAAAAAKSDAPSAAK